MNDPRYIDMACSIKGTSRDTKPEKVGRTVFKKQTKNLEKHEKDKYNFLVSEHEYGLDFRREKQITRITKSLGEVSSSFIDILSELKNQERYRVLDVGSGPGGIMEWLLKKHGADVYGIDISDKFVELSKKHFPHIKNVFVGNARNMSMFQDSYFDLVQHLDGMEHIPVKWEEDCLKEAVRVSNKYIFYETACSDAAADGMAINGGFTKAHINLKTGEQWLDFYKDRATDYNYKIISQCFMPSPQSKNPNETYDLDPKHFGSFGIILEKTYD